MRLHYDNLVGALVTASDTGRHRTVVQLSEALRNYQRLAHLHRDVITHGRRLLTACQKSGDRREEAFAWNELGSAFDRTNDEEKARDHYQRAARLFAELGDNHAELGVLHNLGKVLTDLGEYESGEELLRRAAARWESQGLIRAAAMARNNLGTALIDCEVHDHGQEPLTHFTRALAIYLQLRGHYGEVRSLECIGYFLCSKGRQKEAIGYFEAALRRSRVTDGRQDTGVLSGLFLAHLDRGNLPKALACLERMDTTPDSQGTQSLRAGHWMVYSATVLKKGHSKRSAAGGLLYGFVTYRGGRT